MEIDRIMIMGTGAVGGYFGGRISERTRQNVSLIARGKHLQALKNNGLLIKSPDGNAKIDAPVYEEPKNADKPDLILFTVKSYDTPEAIRQIRSAITDHTQILTLQNGIDNYLKLAETFGEERVIRGFCKIGAGVPKPGIVEHKAFGEITIGEQDGSESERVKAIQQLFREAEIPITISPYIREEVWLKFTWNCIFNMLTAVANVTVEKLFKSYEGERLCYDLYNEIQEVAEREGIRMGDQAVQKMIASARKLEGFETSTYQDRQKGKKLEYEAFTGAIIRLADKYGIRVPRHQTLYALLKTIDEN